MVPQEFLKALAIELGISENEFEVLSRAIQGERMPAISKRLGVRVDALQKRLGEVYKKFEITGAGPGKLAKLQQILISEYQKQAAAKGNGSSGEYVEQSHTLAKPVADTSKTLLRLDWGEAPDVPIFYNRTQELTTLEQWIVKDSCRLVVLLGMGGIGKTALAVRIVQQIQNKFEIVIWRSLRYTPSIQELLAELIQSLSDHKETALPEDVGDRISLLVKYLRYSRCLLVLDEVESILQSGELAGGYQNGYEGYGDLFKKVGESHHKSCLLLTSWNKPIEISSLAAETTPVRVLEMGGLDEESAKRIILSSKGFSNSEKGLLSELIHLHGGNASILKILATNFLSNENLSEIIKQNTLVIGDLLRGFLNQRFEELSELETHIMSWLALHNEPVAPSEMKSNIIFFVDSSELTTAIESLVERSLIEKITGNEEYYYTVSQKVKQQITHRLLAKYLNQLGHNEYLSGNLKSAKDYLMQAIRFNSELVAAHYNLGATCEQLEDLSNARSHYQIAASYNNRAAYAAISNLARLEILAGNIEEAVKIILPILQQVKDDVVKAALHKNLGWAYLVQNRYDEAQKHLLLSIDLNREHAPAHCIMAQVKEAKGDRDGAIAFWENCLKYSSIDNKPVGVSGSLPELQIWRLMARQRLTPPSITRVGNADNSVLTY